MCVGRYPRGSESVQETLLVRLFSSLKRPLTILCTFSSLLRSKTVTVLTGAVRHYRSVLDRIAWPRRMTLLSEVAGTQRFVVAVSFTIPGYI